MAVISKPAGIVTSGNKHRTLNNALPSILRVNDDYKARAVHRLDYETSGLIIISKTEESNKFLSKSLENKEIQKQYLAVSIGEMQAKEESVIIPIEGKKSHTQYKILKTLYSEKYGFLNLLSITLHSGRRNQIRKHLHAIGNPILGDKKFFIEGKLSYGNGLYLHAHYLKFIHPIKNCLIEIESDVPKKFERLFSEY